MRVGSYLGMNFVTSDYRILTPKSGVSRTISARFATHTPIGGKPKLEYLGRESETVDFTIELDVMHGVRPQTLIQQIKRKVGKHGNLVLGGRKIGRYALKSANITYEDVAGSGYVSKATVDLSLEEYT
jgi:hypothetical protein